MDDELDPARLKWLKELLDDCEHTTRLSEWEVNFMDDMRSRLLQYGERIRVSEKQLQVLERIEQKMYA